MIKSAAIKVSDGRIFTGSNHSSILNRHIPLLVYNEEGIKSTEGFFTDKSEFLNRKQAYRHAKKCGQLISENSSKLLYDYKK
jgi:hypothetical protein